MINTGAVPNARNIPKDSKDNLQQLYSQDKYWQIPFVRNTPKVFKDNL